MTQLQFRRSNQFRHRAKLAPKNKFGMQKEEKKRTAWNFENSAIGAISSPDTFCDVHIWLHVVRFLECWEWVERKPFHFPSGPVWSSHSCLDWWHGSPRYPHRLESCKRGAWHDPSKQRGLLYDIFTVAVCRNIWKQTHKHTHAECDKGCLWLHQPERLCCVTQVDGDEAQLVCL